MQPNHHVHIMKMIRENWEFPYHFLNTLYVEWNCVPFQSHKTINIFDICHAQEIKNNILSNYLDKCVLSTFIVSLTKFNYFHCN